MTNRQPVLFIVRTGRTIEHFGDPVGDALIVNRPLREWQERIGRLAGAEVRFVDSVPEAAAPCFVMDDDVFCTAPALQEFVRRAEQGGVNVQAAVARHPMLDAVVATHGAEERDGTWTYRLRYIANDDGKSTSLALPLPDLESQRMRVPRAIRPDGIAWVYRSAFAVQHIRSPLHIYQANMHAVAAATMERAGRFAFQRRANVGQPERANRVGAACDIHSTAVVENCQIGDGVTVGAYAVCRDSVIGSGAHVWDAAIIQMSVVGEYAMVGHQYRVLMSVMYPHAFATSGALQFSITGRESAVFAAWVTDVRLDGKTVQVPMDGGIVDSGMIYFGLIAGHRAKVTAGMITAPGRVVPNDTVLYPDPSLVYRGPRRP